MAAGNPAVVVDWCDEDPDSVLREAGAGAKPRLLGLPCVSCGAYYEAEFTTCPLCGSDTRVSALAFESNVHVTSRAA